MRELAEKLLPTQQEINRLAPAGAVPHMTWQGHEATGVAKDRDSYLLFRGDALVAVYPHLLSLNPREQVVLIRRFGLGDDESWTLQRIADYIHLSKERVRQIEFEALDKIRLALGVITKTQYLSRCELYPFRRTSRQERRRKSERA